MACVSKIVPSGQKKNKPTGLHTCARFAIRISENRELREKTAMPNAPYDTVRLVHQPLYDALYKVYAQVDYTRPAWEIFHKCDESRGNRDLDRTGDQKLGRLRRFLNELGVVRHENQVDFHEVRFLCFFPPICSSRVFAGVYQKHVAQNLRKRMGPGLRPSVEPVQSDEVDARNANRVSASLRQNVQRGYVLRGVRMVRSKLRDRHLFHRTAHGAQADGTVFALFASDSRIRRTTDDAQRRGDQFGISGRGRAEAQLLSRHGQGTVSIAILPFAFFAFFSHAATATAFSLFLLPSPRPHPLKKNRRAATFLPREFFFHFSPFVHPVQVLLCTNSFFFGGRGREREFGFFADFFSPVLYHTNCRERFDDSFHF